MTTAHDALRSTCTLVTFSTSSWVGRRQDKRIVEEVAANHSAHGKVGTWSTNLLANNDAQLREVNNAITAAGNTHKALTSPWTGFKARLLSNVMFKKYLIAMNWHEKDLAAKKDELLANWDDLVERAKQSLATLADHDYPTRQQMADRFSFRYDFQPIPEAAEFRSLKPGGDWAPEAWSEVMTWIEKKATLNEKAALQVAINDAFNNVKQSIEPLLAQLRKESKVRLFDSYITNINSAVELLRGVNVVADPKINSWCDEVERFVANLSFDSLRKDQAERDTVATEAERLIAAVQSLAA